MGIATTKIVFRKDKLNKQNEAPICIRLIKNRKPGYISTGVKIDQKHWDFSQNKVRKSHPNSSRLNQILNQFLVDITDKALALQGKEANATVKQLKSDMFGSKGANFFDIGEELVKKYNDRGNIGTAAKCNSILNKLKLYTNSKVDFNEITPRFLGAYESYALNDLGNCQNTVSKDLRFIRTIFNYAIRQDIIPESLYPFKKFQIKIEKTKRDYLTADEIRLIEKIHLKTERQSLTRDIVLFILYSGGIRISDLITLQWKQIAGDRINMQIRKTGEQLSNKLNLKALDILSKYYPKRVNDESFVFGCIKDGIDINDPILLDSIISSETAVINKGLKSIAKLCGIEKNISTHIFRHTFATLALRGGMPIQHVQSILKHSNIRETMIYAKIINQDVDESLLKFEI